MARLYYQTNGGNGLRGTFAPNPDWPYGSRQVRRAGMRAMFFRHATMTMPRMGRAGRRARRNWARLKTAIVYAETAQSMRESGLTLEKGSQTFVGRLRTFAKELFQ